MLLDSDNEYDEEINSKGEAFVEDKWLQFTEQDNWNTGSFARSSKSLFKEKEAPKFVAHGDSDVWFIMRLKKEF